MSDEEELQPVDSERTLFVYTRTQGQLVMIISDEVIKKLKTGNVMITPDNQLVLAYSHDIEETAAQADMMHKCSAGGMIDRELLRFVVQEGALPKKKRKVPNAVANSPAKKKAAKVRRRKTKGNLRRPTA